MHEVLDLAIEILTDRKFYCSVCNFWERPAFNDCERLLILALHSFQEIKLFVCSSYLWEIDYESSEALTVSLNRSLSVKGYLKNHGSCIINHENGKSREKACLLWPKVNVNS